jgi:guanylate kinase
MHLTSNKVFCLVGPSGTGKDAVAHALPIPRITSYRTREIRNGEEDGVHGHFISREEFLKMDAQGMWIAKTNYADNFYGITQGELLPLEEKPMAYVIDWPGVLTLKETFRQMEGYAEEDIVSIFIHTPREELETRMRFQRRDAKEIKVRLDRADRDYAFSERCDYVVQNNNGLMDTTMKSVLEIILKESFK